MVLDFGTSNDLFIDEFLYHDCVLFCTILFLKKNYSILYAVTCYLNIPDNFDFLSNRHLSSWLLSK